MRVSSFRDDAILQCYFQFYNVDCRTDTIITSAKEVMFSPASVYLLVCYQDYTKTAKRISTKLAWSGILAQSRPH